MSCLQKFNCLPAEALRSAVRRQEQPPPPQGARVRAASEGCCMNGLRQLPSLVSDSWRKRLALHGEAADEQTADEQPASATPTPASRPTLPISPRRPAAGASAAPSVRSAHSSRSMLSAAAQAAGLSPQSSYLGSARPSEASRSSRRHATAESSAPPSTTSRGRSRRPTGGNGDDQRDVPPASNRNRGKSGAGAGAGAGGGLLTPASKVGDFTPASAVQPRRSGSRQPTLLTSRGADGSMSSKSLAMVEASQCNIEPVALASSAITSSKLCGQETAEVAMWALDRAAQMVSWDAVHRGTRDVASATLDMVTASARRVDEAFNASVAQLWNNGKDLDTVEEEADGEGSEAEGSTRSATAVGSSSRSEAVPPAVRAALALVPPAATAVPAAGFIPVPALKGMPPPPLPSRSNFSQGSDWSVQSSGGFVQVHQLPFEHRRVPEDPRQRRRQQQIPPELPHAVSSGSSSVVSCQGAQVHLTPLHQDLPRSLSMHSASELRRLRPATAPHAPAAAPPAPAAPELARSTSARSCTSSMRAIPPSTVVSAAASPFVGSRGVFQRGATLQAADELMQSMGGSAGGIGAGFAPPPRSTSFASQQSGREAVSRCQSFSSAAPSSRAGGPPDVLLPPRVLRAPM